MPGVILQQQFVDRLAKVPEKPLGDRAILDDPAGYYRQIRQQIVTAAAWNSSRNLGVQFCEPFSQLSMWVATSDLPTSGPTSAISLPIRAAKWVSAASLLNLSHSSPQPEAGTGELGARQRMPDAKDRPLALRHVPRQSAGAVHVCR